MTTSIAVIDAGAAASVLAEDLVRLADRTSRLSAKWRWKRPLREAGALGDLRHRGLVEAVLAVELEGRLPEAAARVGLPAGHEPILVTAETVIAC